MPTITPGNIDDEARQGWAVLLLHLLRKSAKLLAPLIESARRAGPNSGNDPRAPGHRITAGSSLMPRLILALFLLATSSTAVLASDDLPYGASLSFAAVRNGQTIGHHRLTFQKNGEQLTVSTAIDLAVKFMGVTAYRYTHRAQEVWSRDTFQGLTAQTDDDGKKYAIRVQRHGAALTVERNARPDALSPATLDQGLPRDDVVRTTLPPQLLPSTHWNVRQIRQSALLNTQTGAEARIQVSVLGRETIRTATASIDATRYRYTVDLVMDQWFDDAGRWVKTSFIASDGSTIEYVLQ
jgi:hypothetical protein